MEVRKRPPEDKADADYRGDRVLGLYMRDIGRYPVLSREEEFELGLRVKNIRESIQTIKSELDNASTEKEKNELTARLDAAQKEFEENVNALVTPNLRLVVHVAKRYTGRGMAFIDLIQEGNLGLRHAVTKFDVDKTFRLGSYAVHWIRQSICRALADRGRTVRIPVYIREVINKVSNFERKFVNLNGRRPTPEEIGSALELSPYKTEQALEYMNYRDFEIDAPVGDEGDLFYRDLLKDGAPEPLEGIASAQRNEIIGLLLGELNEKQQHIIKKRYGLSPRNRDTDPLTLEQVGSGMNLTRERVRQIQERAEMIMGRNLRRNLAGEEI